jgi:hypothetical protein
MQTVVKAPICAYIQRVDLFALDQVKPGSAALRLRRSALLRPARS